MVYYYTISCWQWMRHLVSSFSLQVVQSTSQMNIIRNDITPTVAVTWRIGGLWRVVVAASDVGAGEPWRMMVPGATCLLMMVFPGAWEKAQKMTWCLWGRQIHGLFWSPVPEDTKSSVVTLLTNSITLLAKEYYKELPASLTDSK